MGTAYSRLDGNYLSFVKEYGTLMLLMLCFAQQHHLMALALNVIQPATPYYGDFTLFYYSCYEGFCKGKKMTLRACKLLFAPLIPQNL